jgi:hypothetical protein
MPARTRDRPAPTEEYLKPITFEDVRIIFRNFSGKPGRFNAEGDRNFCFLLDDELAEAMKADGFNIRELKPRVEGEAPQPILEVKVKYKKRDGTRTMPPRVVLITSRGKTNLDEDMVSVIDYAQITYVDLIINPRRYNVGGREGISAYLKSIYVTIAEDELELKYIDTPDSGVPDSAINTMGREREVEEVIA